jgi:hypothetical protein
MQPMFRAVISLDDPKTSSLIHHRNGASSRRDYAAVMTMFAVEPCDVQRILFSTALQHEILPCVDFVCAELRCSPECDRIASQCAGSLVKSSRETIVYRHSSDKHVGWWKPALATVPERRFCKFPHSNTLHRQRICVTRNPMVSRYNSRLVQLAMRNCTAWRG